MWVAERFGSGVPPFVPKHGLQNLLFISEIIWAGGREWAAEVT